MTTENLIKEGPIPPDGLLIDWADAHTVDWDEIAPDATEARRRLELNGWVFKDGCVWRPMMEFDEGYPRVKPTKTPREILAKLTRRQHEP